MQVTRDLFVCQKASLEMMLAHGIICYDQGEIPSEPDERALGSNL